MSSRLIAIGFCLVDALATLLTFVHCSATMVVVMISLATSLFMAMLSWLVRSVMWPTYFWEQPGQIRGSAR